MYRTRRDEREVFNRHKAETIVRLLRKMIDEPTDFRNDEDMARIIAAILNHEDRPFGG